MTEKADKYDEKEDSLQPVDPIAVFLFLLFIGTGGYLLVASTVGLYPWMPILDTLYFIPTWEAVITFLSILTIMFLSLIGGLVKMRYSIFLVGFVLLIAVFLITFYTMLLFSGLTAPIP